MIFGEYVIDLRSIIVIICIFYIYIIYVTVVFIHKQSYEPDKKIAGELLYMLINVAVHAHNPLCMDKSQREIDNLTHLKHK